MNTEASKVPTTPAQCAAIVVEITRLARATTNRQRSQITTDLTMRYPTWCLVAAAGSVVSHAAARFGNPPGDRTNDVDNALVILTEARLAAGGAGGELLPHEAAAAGLVDVAIATLDGPAAGVVAATEWADAHASFDAHELLTHTAELLQRLVGWWSTNPGAVLDALELEYTEMVLKAVGE